VQLFFALTLFVSATLLFIVQPMFAKMVLPLLGGSPAVWNTCMVFYQGSLLAGYLYAHFSTRWLGVRRQAGLHLLILCLPWLVLPVAMATAWTPPAETNPIPWLLMLLTVSVGLPFFVVSASAPMLQAWFANTGHPAAKDPYFLYAASNLGSMLALLGYPIIVEPSLSLGGQSVVWTTGYGLLMVLTAGCAVFLWRRAPKMEMGIAEEEPGRDVPLGDDPTISTRMRWLVLSFAPSSLLLGVTTHISTDIAAVPLLWVVPLALYLLTFVLVFARRSPLPHELMVRVQPFVVILLAVLFFHGVSKMVWLKLLLHLVTFFVIAMVCHGELAKTRPRAKYLTEFYIWMSVGGVLGGLFNAMVAPNIFSSIVEYPLVIAVACLLRPKLDSPHATGPGRWFDLALPAAMVFGLGGLVMGLQARGILMTEGSTSVILAVAGLIVFSFQARPIRFGLGMAAIFVVGSLAFGQSTSVLHVERNFFGVIRVSRTASPATHVMSHGSTNHGMQRQDPDECRQAIGYYHHSGPLGQVFATLGGPDHAREIGIIGLGTGGITAYAQPGQRVVYYEIDPAVERLARDPQYFTYLRDCKAETDVVLGDARLTIGAVADSHFDLLILDAFTSDAIPIHLITREAIGMYLEKLAPQGVLVLHISNRYLDLEPILGNIADDLGAVCHIQKDREVSDQQRAEGKFPSTWAVIARRPEHLAQLANNPKWKPVPKSPDYPLWTDDFSNILTVLRWW
jgi:hypothetical protein